MPFSLRPSLLSRSAAAPVGARRVPQWVAVGIAVLGAAPALANDVPVPVAILGRLHFPLLHFPIALLFAAVVVEFAMRKRLEEARRREVVGLLASVAAAAAVITAISGLAYAEGEDFGGAAADTFFIHRAGGLIVAGLSVLAALGSRVAPLAKVMLPSLVLASVGAIFVGHQGGSLVHGANFFAKAFKSPGDAPTNDGDDGDDKHPDDDDDDVASRLRYPEGAIPEKPDYVTHIKPLFERSCLKCHGPEKRKSGLRLDKRRFAMKGGESGDVIIPGNAAKSLVYSMTALPPDDDDVMPSKGKLLSLSEQQTLQRWIDQGAHWPDDETP